jgi:hypothetical protein
MQAPRWRSVVRVVVAIIACAGAFWQLSLQARLYAGRVRYPWDVEWLESSALYQAYRVKVGLSTYGPPKDGYLPLMHPPAYPTALGLIGRVTGLDYGMARTLSLLCFVVAGALLVRALVRHEEGKLEGWVLGAFAVGCAAAGVPVFEGFYDLVREDVMAVLLCVVCADLADTAPKMSPKRIALLSVVIAAIVYTRLPAVFFPVWVTIFVFARHRRTGVLLAITAIAACGLTLVALQYASKGWYWMYTVSLLQDQHIIGTRFLLGLTIVAKWAPFVIAVPFATLALALTRRIQPRTALWVGMLVASIPASLLPFAKVGGFANDFMPMVFMVGPATAFLVSDGLRAFAGHPRVALLFQSLLFVGSAVFFWQRTYDFKRFVPTEEAFRRAAALNAKVASLDGGVIVPRHPFLPIHNGHKSLQWSDMPYLDMIWSGFGDLNLGGYIDKSHARWAVVSGNEIHITAREIAARYQLEGLIGDAPQVVIGERSMMRYLFRWQDDEKDARVLFDFEKPLEGWTITGDAFAVTPARPKGQAPIAGVVGQQLANSYHPTQRDTARGMMTSPKFTIDRPRMGLRVGGGWRSGTRVELRVDGRQVRTATGIFEGSETMIKVVWDVKPFMNREAQVVLVDQDAGPWGHLLCDHVVLY